MVGQGIFLSKRFGTSATLKWLFIQMGSTVIFQMFFAIKRFLAGLVSVVFLAKTNEHVFSCNYNFCHMYCMCIKTSQLNDNVTDGQLSFLFDQIFSCSLQDFPPIWDKLCSISSMWFLILRKNYKRSYVQI